MLRVTVKSLPTVTERRLTRPLMTLPRMLLEQLLLFTKTSHHRRVEKTTMIRLTVPRSTRLKKMGLP